MASVWFALGVALAAVSVAIAVRRSGRRAPLGATVDADGVGSPSSHTDWHGIEAVTVLTRHRRLPARTEFALVVDAADGASYALSSRTGQAQRFLAEAHRLPGFPHRRVVELLAVPAAQREQCWRRGP
ncbi:MAG: hypothetical protein AB7W59_30295 [Acidimicrobiia bacterium]